MGHSSEQEAASSVGELRSMLAAAQEESRSARTSAAHHRLQYELLTMDSSEALKRKDVELDMARREVDVLQRSKGNATSPTTGTTSQDQILVELRHENHLLKKELDRCRGRLTDAKRYIIDSEASRTDEATNLRKRIRDNRHHMTRLRRCGSLFGEVLPTKTATKAGQHESYSATPKGRGGEGIGALLDADQFLSQEAVSTPATPLGSRTPGHHRNVQSLTSLPTTPYRAVPRSAGPYYVKPTTPSPKPTQARRHQSRDSTISASDGEGTNNHDGAGESEDDYGTDADEDIRASQASQEAVNMLRKSASFGRSNIHSPPSKAPSAPMTAKQAAAKQHMMYGYQLKPGAPGQESIKRRFYDDGPDVEAGRARKKGRMSMSLGGNEGVGLGIGGWAK